MAGLSASPTFPKKDNSVIRREGSRPADATRIENNRCGVFRIASLLARPIARRDKITVAKQNKRPLKLK
jgi:hypothetical protein